MPERVLIAPLHWGLGHATRCIPLIEQELAAGAEVLISANSGPKALLQARFPQLRFVDIPFMTITYPQDGNMSRHFFWRGPQLLLSIWREHRHLQRLVKAEKIDKVISDSRFGLWSRKCRSIFVSHQLEIKSPQFQNMINMLNRWVMRQYDEVWVPDYEASPGLAGQLSHPKKALKTARYIGPLSRFKERLELDNTPHWEAMAIISGPEPQRSHFEANLIREFVENDTRAIVLRGKPEDNDAKEIGNLKVIGHLQDEALLDALKSAKRVISRSGYSTIMDFHVLGIKADFAPTPGQTEQEYLAVLHKPDQSR